MCGCWLFPSLLTPCRFTRLSMSCAGVSPIPVPNEHTDVYEKLAKKYGCYIQTGTFLEADPDFPDCVFNTTVLIGPGGVLSKYRKVNPWIPWEVHASPHDIPDYPHDPFPVVDTELGKLGVAICYDWLFPETIRQIAFNGAEVLIRVSAYMDPWGTAEPTDWWTLINRTRALENTAYVVASNQGARMAHYPPFSWPGGSMVVDYDGRILSQADPGPVKKSSSHRSILTACATSGSGARSRHACAPAHRDSRLPAPAAIARGRRTEKSMVNRYASVSRSAKKTLPDSNGGKG